MTMAGGGGGDIKATWGRVVEQVKKEVIAPGLWRALEKTVPVVWEGSNFVIGLSPMDGQMAGQLNTGEYRGAIERTLRRVAGNNDLVFRMIEGTTLSDWEYTKARDAAAVSQRQQTAQKRYVEAGAFASWDEIYEQVSRLWANFEYRSLSSGKGRFLDQALGLCIKGMESLMPADGTTNEQIERGLSRVLERIGGITNSDPAVLAYLLSERRRKGE